MHTLPLISFFSSIIIPLSKSMHVQMCVQVTNTHRDTQTPSSSSSLVFSSAHIFSVRRTPSSFVCQHVRLISQILLWLTIEHLSAANYCIIIIVNDPYDYLFWSINCWNMVKNVNLCFKCLLLPTCQRYSVYCHRGGGGSHLRSRNLRTLPSFFFFLQLLPQTYTKTTRHTLATHFHAEIPPLKTSILNEIINELLVAAPGSEKTQNLPSAHFQTDLGRRRLGWELLLKTGLKFSWL